MRHAPSFLTRSRQSRWHSPDVLSAQMTPLKYTRSMSMSSHTRDGAPGSRLTHIDKSGRPAMVDVGSKSSTERSATALGRIFIPKVAYDLIAHTPTTLEPAAASSPELEQAKAKARGKGDVLTVAQLAAIMGCKRTSDLIPLCHPLQLSHIAVQLHLETHLEAAEADSSSAEETPRIHSRSGKDSALNSGDIVRVVQQPPAPTKTSTAPPEDIQSRPLRYSILCTATVKCEGKTGVEMEALTAVSVGLLTVWDMLKAVAGKEMVIGEIFVSHKAGGKSGDFQRTSC